MAERVVERVERTLGGVLDEGVRAGVFPGASASVGVFDGQTWTFVDVVRGKLGVGLDATGVDAIYDLASLTKPFVATTALMLHQQGSFDLAAPVSTWVAEAARAPIGDRTWEEVLSHRSGLEAWVPFYEALPHAPGTAEARAWVLEQLVPHWDQARVGTPVYSDLGYILAGLALERASGVPLAELVLRQVTASLGIEANAFFAASDPEGVWLDLCAETGRSAWRGRVLRGEVHDDNCAALGGVAGHAGMFGTAQAVARFGAAQVGALHGRHGALAEERVAHAVAPRPGGSHRLGWDGKDDEGSAAGRYIDADAFGHLGFTGTSLWCDPRRQLVVAVLTNRVAVSDDNAAIRAFRPAAHDAIIEAFDGF